MKNHNQFNLFAAGILICLSAVLVNILFYSTSQAFGAQYLVPLESNPTRNTPLPFLTVVILTLAAAILATLLYGVLTKLTPGNILPPFISVVVTALLVSFGGPMEIPGASLQTRLLLSTMHVTAAAVILGGLLTYHFKFRAPFNK